MLQVVLAVGNPIQYQCMHERLGPGLGFSSHEKSSSARPKLVEVVGQDEPLDWSMEYICLMRNMNDVAMPGIVVAGQLHEVSGADA